MNTKKNCIIRETLNLWTDAGSKPKQRWATQTWSYLFPLQEPSFFLYKNLACSLHEAKSDKILKKYIFFWRRFLTIPKQKCSKLRPLLSNTYPQGFQVSKKLWDWTWGSGQKKNPKRSEPSLFLYKNLFCFLHKARYNKKIKKAIFCAAILYHFQATMFKYETASFHYFFPSILNL